MDGSINYSSEVVEESKSLVRGTKNQLESVSDSYGSLDTVLSSGLFSGGYEKIKSQTKSVANAFQSIIDILSNHDRDMENTNSLVMDLVKNYCDSHGGTYRDEKRDKRTLGTVINSNEIDTEEVEEGKEISSNKLSDYIVEMDYSTALQTLKNIVKKGGDLEVLLTDRYSANICSYELRNILGEETDLGKVVTSDDTLVQRKLLEKVVSFDEETLAQIDQNTILKAIPYLKNVANDNDIDVCELIQGDDKESLLLKSLNDIYNGESSLGEASAGSVRNYLDDVASSNGISTKRLLSSTNYMSLIKGGGHV